MPTNDQLDGFLTAGAPAEEPAQAPEPQPAPEPAAKPETPPQPAAKAKEAEPKPEPDEDEALAQHVQGGDNRTVPFSALEKVRNDWKSKAAAAQAQADELRRQLEEAKKPPPPPPQVQQAPQLYQPIDPVQDPQGYQQRLEARMLNERLNHSELILRKELGGEAVDALVAEFKEEAARDPSLFQKLYSQLDPYGWAAKHLETVRMHREIGDDPAAYRARIVAEERAKWEAEAPPAAPRVSPANGMPPSLANARSVAGRGTTAFTGPPSMDDILRRPERRNTH
jgi:hypothetical protein